MKVFSSRSTMRIIFSSGIYNLLGPRDYNIYNTFTPSFKLYDY